ncbi:MAG: exopolyphosphatase [Eubacteriales bacterium]|nr:exopolyphosphatase [Eubacteriales bacterium]
MAVTLFAAIDVGSYEVEMKIYELASRVGIRQIDYVSHRIEMGTDTYTRGKISVEKIEELCRVLQDFVRIMEGYKVSGYRACATSAIREAQNSRLLLEYVKRTTGITVENLDNSEQRFLDYKSIAFGLKDFYKIIQKGTAIVDVGSGSVQVSLFDNDKLVTTQNIRIGNLRIREKVADLARQTVHVEAMVEELINNEIVSFKKMYLKDREIKNLILGGDYIYDLMKKESVSRAEFELMFEKVVESRPEDIAREYGIPSESASLILPSVTLYKRLIEELGAEMIWLSDMALSDGIAYDYAQKKKFIRTEHEFKDDIVAAARVIAKRYQCNKGHIRNLENLALPLFDRIRKSSGMADRHRLLLQIAVILHGCGKYINFSNAADCSYSIIMSTEIIGLSLRERQIIANVVKFNTKEMHYEDTVNCLGMNPEEYLLIMKLTAILRVANALDRSHKQKFDAVRLSIKERELIIQVDTREDITLERGLFPPKAEFFEEVFHIRPVIRQKKHL